MLLQSAHRLYGDQIDHEAISVIAGVVPDVREPCFSVFNSVNLIIQRDVSEVMTCVKSNVFARTQDRINKLVLDGYSGTQFLEQVR